MSYKEERNKSAEPEISKDHTILDIESNVKEAIESWPKKFATFIYNSDDGTVCLRTPLSWLKLILTTSFYYCLLIGMVYGFYLLFVKVEYGTIDLIEGAPLAHAPPGSIWPTIMKSPDLNIRYEPLECRYCMSVAMNRVFFWEPEVYTGQNPANDTELSKHLQDLEEAMKKTGSTLDFTEKMAFVTCDGKDKESKDMLEGLKFRLNNNMTSPGFYMNQFPYGREEESWQKIILDLSDTQFVSQGEKNKQRIKMQCRAWANNIDQDERQSYKGKIPGGDELFVYVEVFQYLDMPNHKNVDTILDDLEDYIDSLINNYADDIVDEIEDYAYDLIDDLADEIIPTTCTDLECIISNPLYIAVIVIISIFLLILVFCCCCYSSKCSRCGL